MLRWARLCPSLVCFSPTPSLCACPSLLCVWCPTAPRQFWSPVTTTPVSFGGTATESYVPTCNQSQCRLKQPWHLDRPHLGRHLDPCCAIVPWRHSDTCEYTKLLAILRAVRREELTCSAEVYSCGLTSFVSSPSLRALVASSRHPEQRTCIKRASVLNDTHGCWVSVTKWTRLKLTWLGRAASLC